MSNKHAKSLKATELEGLGTPLGFTKGVLQLQCYPWAERILCDLDRRGAVAVRAANGSGKTSRLAASSALWHAAVFPKSLTICTAGVFRQVKEQLFPAIRSHAHKFRGWQFFETEVETHHGSRILGFSTDDPGRFEGWHAENLLMIVDEAKSVAPSIFEAIERCQPSRLLLLSSPGGCSGYFYDAFNTRRKFFRQHTITAHDCPHISRDWINEQIEKYGEHHPLVRSMIFAEFMSFGEDGAVIPLAFVERCLASPPALVESGRRQAFCDFAAGGDENVLAVRRGNKVEIVSAWREQDTMKAVGRFIMLFKAQGLQPGEISADEGGLGVVMCDALKEAGWFVHRVNNGAAARDEHYANAGAEIWFEGRTMIERQQVILPAGDSELIAQLTARRGWPNSRGKLELESKADLRSRGLPSPDRADAVLGCMAGTRSHAGQVEVIDKRRNSIRESSGLLPPRIDYRREGLLF